MSHGPVDKEKVQEFYDTFLASEPGKHSDREEFRTRFEPVLAHLKAATCGRERQQVTVQDIGCGTGNVAERYRPFGRVYGVDISPKSVAEALANHRCDECAVGTAEEVPYGDAFFDVVICTEVIEHVLNVDRAIAEMRRVVKPGGRVILSTPNPWSYPVIRMKLAEKIKGKRYGQIIDDPLPRRVLTRKFESQGLRVADYDCVYISPDGLRRWFGGGVMKGLFRPFSVYQIFLLNA